MHETMHFQSEGSLSDLTRQETWHYVPLVNKGLNSLEALSHVTDQCNDIGWLASVHPEISDVGQGLCSSPWLTLTTWHGSAGHG